MVGEREVSGERLGLYANIVHVVKKSQQKTFSKSWW